MELLYRHRKILAVFGFIAVVFVSGYALYAMFFKTGDTTQEPDAGQTASTTGNTLPGAAENAGGGNITVQPGKLAGQGENRAGGLITPAVSGSPDEVTEVTRAESFGATVDRDGSGVQYYDRQDGKFYRLDENGDAASLSDKIFHGVQTVKWAPGKNKAILEYPDGANIIYNFDDNKQITLPNHWKDFDFSPDGRQIVMKSIGSDPGNRWLAITDENGSKARKLESIGENENMVYPSWSPNNQIAAMYVEGRDFNRQEVYFIGLNKENFKAMTVEGRGFQPKWAPEGDRLLYSVYSTDTDLKPVLWIANAQGDRIGTGRKKLEVETWADKCVFADAYSLYCAVPDALEAGAGLFPDMARGSADKLYAIDTRTGMKNLVSTPDGNYNMSDLMLSDDSRTLYFTDSNSNKIYKINLE